MSIVDENKLIQTIVLGSDWQEVIASIVVEEGMDPMSIDIIRLADSFMIYLHRMKKFDFRVPARFILIASVLLRMKCEMMLEEEMKKEELEKERIPPINVDDVPSLSPPILRRPTRKVTLNELVNALNKALEFKERKETSKLRMRRAVENLIEPEEDIEIRINRIFDEILRQGTYIRFSDLVPVWKRKEIVDTFIPLLHLSQRGKVECEQEGFFKEIMIRVC